MSGQSTVVSPAPEHHGSILRIWGAVNGLWRLDSPVLVLQNQQHVAKSAVSVSQPIFCSVQLSLARPA